jgi:hypothetical protein
MKRRVYCLAVMESLSPVGSLESFRATLTKNLSIDCCFCLLFRISALSRQTSSTRTAKYRSFIKLKFLQNFCSSCKTLADQVARNPRFYCNYFNVVLRLAVFSLPIYILCQNRFLRPKFITHIEWFAVITVVLPCYKQL